MQDNLTQTIKDSDLKQFAGNTFGDCEKRQRTLNGHQIVSLSAEVQDNNSLRKRDLKAESKLLCKAVNVLPTRNSIRRPRKSQQTLDILSEFYYTLDGKMPSSDQIREFSEKHQMKPGHVYKWLWDTCKVKGRVSGLANQVR